MAVAAVAAVVAAVAAVATTGVTIYQAGQQADAAKVAAVEDQQNRNRIADQMHAQYVQQQQRLQKNALLSQGKNIAQLSKSGFMVNPDNSFAMLMEENERQIEADSEALFTNYSIGLQDLNYASNKFQKSADDIIDKSRGQAFGALLKGGNDLYVASRGFSFGSKSSPSSINPTLSGESMAYNPTTYS